jgi:hypothetical protein
MAEESQTPQKLNSDLFNQGTTDIKDFTPFQGEKLDLSDDMFKYKPIIPSLQVNQLPIRENITGYPPNTNIPDNKNITTQDFFNYLTNGVEKYHNNKAYIRPHSYDASAQGAHKARYKAFGQKTYDRIGFNPEINNELMYNSNVTGMDRTLRLLQHSALPLLLKGAITGPKSYYQMAHGNFGADTDEAQDYEDATAIGYDSAGGLLGFTNNVLNSFSYSLGILGEGALEGAIVGGALGSLAGPGGTGAGAAAGAIEGGITSLLKAPKALWSVAKSGKNLLKQLDNLKDISKAKAFFNTAASKTGKFLNPLNNLTDFAMLSKTDEFANLTNLAKTSKGFGAFYFDLRNINMALSEGRLEGGMKENETYREMYDKYYNKHGEAPSDDLQRDYRKVANDVGFWTTLSNATLINYSNKLTVPNIMQGSARRLLAAPEKVLELKGFNVLLDPKKGFEVAEASFKNSLKALRHPGAYGKAGLSYFKANLVEGLQEVSQDVIGEATQKYHMDSYYDPAKVTFDYSLGVIGSAMRKQMSGQGFETFASGFVMGSLHTGIDTAFTGISKKASAGYNKHYNKDKYTEYQADLAETKQRAQDVVDELNTLYKDPTEFFNSKYFNYGTQSRVARIHDDEEADTKQVKDAKDAAFISSIYSMLETGTTKYFVDNFKNLQQQSPTEIEQSLKLKPGEGEKALQKMSDAVEKVKRMEKTHKFWTEKMKSPVNLGQYKKDTPQYEMAAIFQKAWQRGQFNAIFMDESFKENLSRINKINNSLGELSGSQVININDIQLITDPERFITEIDLLTEEIDVLKTLTDPKSKKQIAEKNNKLEAMQNMMEAYQTYYKHDVSKDALKDRIKEIKEKEGLTNEDADIIAMQQAEEDIINSGITYKDNYKKAFIDYLKALVPNEEDLKQVSDGLISADGIKNLDDAFEQIVSSHALSHENKALAKYVNLFLTPEGFAEHVKRNFDWMKNLYLNREDYVKETVDKSIMDLEYNDLLAELAEEDIYVDLDEFADWIEDHNNKPSHFVQASNKRIIPEGSELYNVYYEKFITLAEKYTQKPSGPVLTADEKLKKLIEEKEKQKEAELEDAKIAFNTQLKNDTGSTEEELRSQNTENQTQNTEELKEAQERLDKFKTLLEEIEAADVIVEDLEVIASKALDIELTTEDGFNLFITKYFEDPKKVEEVTPFVEDLTREGVENGLSQEDAVNQAFIIVSYKVAFPELIKEKIKATETEIEQLSASLSDGFDQMDFIESTDAWKDYQEQVKRIEAEYEQVFKDLINDFKKAGAKASTVEEVKTTPTRITVNTPWDNIPTDLQVILQKEFDKYAATNYPDADATKLALIRQNWLPTQSVTIDAYNNAQVGTQETKSELVAKIPKLSSISNKLLDGRSLDQLSMRDLRKVVDRLNELKVEKSKTKNTKNIKDINYIKSDINALTRYIAYVRNTKKPTTKLEGVVELLNNSLLARQDEIDVLFTDGTTAGEAKSLEDLLSKTKKGYKFDNGKEPQRVTKLVEEIEKEETGKDVYIPKVAEDVATYYDTIAFDTSIKDDKKVEEFLKGLKERIINRSFKQLTLKKFEKIKAAVEKEFTREVVFDTVRDLAHIGASDAGSTIDSLIRDYFNTNKKPIKPAEMEERAFEQLFGDNGILTLIMDDVIDGTSIVYANNLNVFDKELGENGLAGEMDLLVIDNEGNLAIIDVKTSTKGTWKNFNTEDPKKFSKKYAYRVQQTIYRNLLFNMIGKKATIKLLPIELDYDLDGRIKTAKLADITDQGKSTVQLIPVDEVDKYVPLKDIKEITDELSKEERAAIQKEIDRLDNDLVMERDINLDQEKADEIIKQIAELQAMLKGEQEVPTEEEETSTEDKPTKVETKTSIEDAKKIIKPTTGLGDLLVEVDEDGDIEVPQFDTILDPMQNAKNAEELMLAYSNAMIAITQGDVPGDQKLLSNAIELKKNEKEIAFSFSSKKSVKAKDLQENDYLVVKKGIFDSVRQDLFIVESITGNKVEIKSLSTGNVYTATDEILKNNFKKHNKMAYEIKEETPITEEDIAAVVETKNNLDDIRKNETMLNEAKENSKSMSKLNRLSKLKNNSNTCK